MKTFKGPVVRELDDILNDTPLVKELRRRIAELEAENAGIDASERRISDYLTESENERQELRRKQGELTTKLAAARQAAHWWPGPDEPRQIPRDEIAALLEKRFSRADYLQLSHKWKLIHIEDVARELFIVLDGQRQIYQQLLADLRSKAELADAESALVWNAHTMGLQADRIAELEAAVSEAAELRAKLANSNAELHELEAEYKTVWDAGIAFCNAPGTMIDAGEVEAYKALFNCLRWSRFWNRAVQP